MQNYEHETDDIRDRYLKQYIYYDYFHDSFLKSINNKESELSIILSCEREWPTYDKKYLNDVQFEYILIFKECKYIEIERENPAKSAEFINGRFKLSAKLQWIKDFPKKKYYHLRIQLADGYIDIIFKDFIITKRQGEVFLPKIFSIDWHFTDIRTKFSNRSIEEVRRLATEGDWLERTNALEYLYLTTDPKVYELALLGLEDIDVRIASVYILGELGIYDSIKILVSYLQEAKDWLIARKHIQDSIEKILYKNNRLNRHRLTARVCARGSAIKKAGKKAVASPTSAHLR